MPLRARADDGLGDADVHFVRVVYRLVWMAGLQLLAQTASGVATDIFDIRQRCRAVRLTLVRRQVEQCGVIGVAVLSAGIEQPSRRADSGCGSFLRRQVEEVS